VGLSGPLRRPPRRARGGCSVSGCAARPAGPPTAARRASEGWCRAGGGVSPGTSRAGRAPRPAGRSSRAAACLRSTRGRPCGWRALRIFPTSCRRWVSGGWRRAGGVSRGVRRASGGLLRPV